MYATSLFSSMIRPSIGAMIGSFSALGSSPPVPCLPSFNGSKGDSPSPDAGADFASGIFGGGGGGGGLRGVAGTEESPFSASMMDTLLATAGHASPLMQTVLFIHRLLGTHLGIDISALLTLLVFTWAFSKVGTVLYDHVAGLVERHFMCAMFVSEDDQIYLHLMKWFSNQPSIRNNHCLMAQTVWKSAWEEEDELDAGLLWTDGNGEGGDKKYLNFSNHEARSNPRFVPAMGFTSFWHRGTFFRLNRRKESLVNTHIWGGAIKDVEEIKISCFGRSMEPVKQLLVDAKAFFYLDDDQRTTIYRPRVKDQRREHHMWQQVARRPVRPMSTVVLDPKEKEGVMEDINEYLHPATPLWYACRGIPLRRGYLFHGPPGTGKTSFSFALAGVFGIDIYVISLQDANITEEDLSTLFTNLPRRCIVLLEDIDTAGLRRDAGSGLEGKGKGDCRVGGAEKQGQPAAQDDEESAGGEDGKGKRRGKGADKSTSASASSSGEGISLSGLLNAIDGVASHEGRILIMTTNKPESLDEALIRPGRVDVQVAFTNATRSQATELFHRMYEASRPKQATALPLEELEKKTLSQEEMREIAGEFGRRIPGDKFSPAEIQGFLLKRKKSPRKALEDAASWVEASLRQKECNSRVSAVQ